MTDKNGDQSEPSPNLFGRRAAYWAMLVASPVLLLFIYLGRVEQGFAAWICAGLMIGVIRIRWDLRKNLWFWMAILVAALLQVPFAMFVPWTRNGYSMFILLPYGILDYIVINWCITLAAKVANRNLAAPSA